MESNTLGSSGPIYRTPRSGPELDLIHSYVKSFLPTAPKGQAVSVFFEPRLDSGFPDAVIVYWHIGTTEEWTNQRTLLTKPDIRVMHYLATHTPASEGDLKRIFSLPIANTLSRLHDARIIIKREGIWKVKPLNRVFAVRRLIAIEAKISSWRKGLEQAIQNTWFASESYLLMQKRPSHVDCFDIATSLGVGLLTATSPLNKSLVKSRKEKIPVSYASWLFNEWAWQSTNNMLN